MSTTGFREMAEMIGTTVRVKVEGFTVPMTISDVKVAYGNKRLLVSPIGGSGEAWVDASRAAPMSINAPARAKATSSKVSREKAESPSTEAGKIRAWAKSRGIHVNERGRIPEPVMREYLKTEESSSTVEVPQFSDDARVAG